MPTHPPDRDRDAIRAAALDQITDDTITAEALAAELGIAVCSAYLRIRRQRERLHLERRIALVREHSREGMTRAELRAAIYEATGIMYGLPSLATAQAQIKKQDRGQR